MQPRNIFSIQKRQRSQVFGLGSFGFDALDSQVTRHRLFDNDMLPVTFHGSLRANAMARNEVTAPEFPDGETRKSLVPKAWFQ